MSHLFNPYAIPESRTVHCRLWHGEWLANIYFGRNHIRLFLNSFFFVFLCGFAHGQVASNPYINDISLLDSSGGVSLSAFLGSKELVEFYNIVKDAENAADLLRILLRRSTAKAKGLSDVISDTKNGCSENEHQPLDTDLRTRKPSDSSETASVSELLNRIIFLKNSDEVLYIHFCLELYGMGFSGISAENGKIIHAHHHSEWSFTVNMVNRPSFNKIYDRPTVLFKQLFDGSRLSSLKYLALPLPARFNSNSQETNDDTKVSVDFEFSEDITPVNLIDFPLPFLGRVDKKDDMYSFYSFEIRNDRHNEGQIQLIAYPKESRGDLIVMIKISFNSRDELYRIEYIGISGTVVTVVIRGIDRRHYPNASTKGEAQSHR